METVINPLGARVHVAVMVLTTPVRNPHIREVKQEDVHSSNSLEEEEETAQVQLC